MFAHADIANALYNPGGSVRASDYRFPYEDASFDFAFAISVFTHLVQDDAANYIAEAARVLASGGRLLSPGCWSTMMSGSGSRPARRRSNCVRSAT